jgi:putative flippase GtrA
MQKADNEPQGILGLRARGLVGSPAALTAGQIVKYVLVGAANTFLTLGTILVLSGAAHADYRFANAVGYVIGLTSSFLLNRWWTFRSEGAVPLQAVKFLLVFGLCYAIQFGLLVLMVGRLKWSPAFSQVAAMGVYTALGFLLNRKVVYNK